MVQVREFMMVQRPWLQDGDLAWYWSHLFVGDRVQNNHGSAPYWSAVRVDYL
jgi:hypothetical protein